MRPVRSANKPPASADREKTSRFSRTTVNFWLDSVLLVNFLALVWITFVLRFVFPPPASASGWFLWGYRYDDWVDLQFWVMCLFVLAILIHVMLHWSWVCGVITSMLPRRDGKPVRWDDGTRTLYGVGLLVVLVNVLGLLMGLASLMVRSP